MSLDVHVSLSNHVNSHADEDSECRRALKERGYVDICDTIRIESARNMKALFMERVATRQTHILGNGARLVIVLDPEKETDERVVCVLDEVYRRMRTCDPKKYDNDLSPRMKEIQLIMNPSENADQEYHIDSFMNNDTLTILLSTGLDEKEDNGTLTMMYPGRYMDVFKLPELLKKKHDVTQHEWEAMLVETVTMINQALSQEGSEEGLTLHSFSVQEREIWTDLLIGNGLLNADGTRLPENELTNSMYDNCNRNKHKVGDGILFTRVPAETTKIHVRKLRRFTKILRGV